MSVKLKYYNKALQFLAVLEKMAFQARKTNVRCYLPSEHVGGKMFVLKQVNITVC